MWDRHAVRLDLVHMLPAIAAERGLRLAPLLGEAGMRDRLDEHGVVSRAQLCALLRGVARAAGDPVIGFALAGAADPGRLGMTGRALFAGLTLRDCLVGHVRQMPGLQAGVAYSLSERGSRACLSHTLLDSEPGHARVLNEGIATFLVRALRTLCGEPEDGLHITLPYRPEAPVRVYEDALRAGVSFDPHRRGLEVSFDAAWLERANPLFGQIGSVAAEAVVPQAAVRIDDAALLCALRDIIEGAALRGSLSLVDAARILGIPPRSLQRRLAGAGTSFETLVDSWRRTTARALLADSCEPVGAIALALGYGHPSHFTRAFHRWEGTAPLAYRLTHLAPNGN